MPTTATPSKLEQQLNLPGVGEITNLPDGSGTRQREPKPEDLPPALRMTPVAEQVNSANSQVVGHAELPAQGDSRNASALEAAAATQQKATTAAQKKVDEA